MAKKKLKVRVEENKVTKPKAGPNCPIHVTRMEYEPIRGVWTCQEPDCQQVSFPPSVLETGKPIYVEGTLELLRVKDPDGSKQGRLLLRVRERNVMVDVTDYVDAWARQENGTYRVRMDVNHFMDHLNDD